MESHGPYFACFTYVVVRRDVWFGLFGFVVAFIRLPRRLVVRIVAVAGRHDEDVSDCGRDEILERISRKSLRQMPYGRKPFVA